MRLIFIHGPAASGKLTVARELSARTGLPVFHNHLVVDTVMAVFPFGSPAFIRLREQFWLETIRAAATEGRPLIFTFTPERTVQSGFSERTRKAVEQSGGQVTFVELSVSQEEQERRVIRADRQTFGKVSTVERLREIQAEVDGASVEHPPADLRIDTAEHSPQESAALIIERFAS